MSHETAAMVEFRKRAIAGAPVPVYPTVVNRIRQLFFENGQSVFQTGLATEGDLVLAQFPGVVIDNRSIYDTLLKYFGIQADFLPT